MKPYFEKLLTEQERAGSRHRSRKWGGRVKYEPDSEYEKQPKGGIQPWSRRWNKDHKDFTDVLGPLRGYLWKSIGRPWDDVYSEICAGMDKRTTTGAHIFTHLWQYVERNTWLGEDGKVYSWSSWRRYEVNEWYIHPVTGLLCYQPDKRRWWNVRKEVLQDKVELSPGKRLQLIDGIWYHTEYAKVDRFVHYYHRRLDMGMNPWSTKEEDVILMKRQLGKKELKKYNLHNVVKADNKQHT